MEISRARHRAELVTDDRDRLRERLEGATGDRIAALESVEPGAEKLVDFGREAEREQEGIEGTGVEELHRCMRREMMTFKITDGNVQPPATIQEFLTSENSSGSPHSSRQRRMASGSSDPVAW